MAMVKVKINGQELEVEEGLNLIEAARRAGVEIPHFCYHPGLGVDGNCRMCLIELDGVPKPQIACNTFTKEGLGFRTDTPRVKEMQRAVLEFLFLNHPLDCPICDQSGECYLQDYYMSNGQYESRLDTAKVHKRKVQRIGPRVVLDAERCVLCTRCIRFCDEVTGTGELYIVNRGNRSEITTYPDRPLDNDYSLNTVDVCPVGALTSDDFRFKKRVWHLKTTRSVCTGCARGCNIYLEQDEGTVYRYRPRENLSVNRYWMCDHGRTTYAPLNEARLEVGMKGEQDLGFTEATNSLRSILESAGPDTQILVSPQSSLETLYAAKRFARDVLGTARIVGANVRPAGPEDNLLRRADQNPNTSGLRKLGLEGDVPAALAKGGKLLIVVEDDPLGFHPEWKQSFAGFQRVLYFGPNENATSRAAQLALPLAPHSESEGTFVNCDDRLQRFWKAITPQGDALSGPELFALAARSLGKTFGWKGPRELWRDLAAEEAAFSGIDYDAIGDLGVTLSGPGAKVAQPV